jgi:hypothetical protein
MSPLCLVCGSRDSMRRVEETHLGLCERCGETSPWFDAGQPKTPPAAGQWVRVEDGMPNAYRMVLTWNGEVRIGFWNHDCWLRDSSQAISSVTHWAPINSPCEETNP